MKTIKTTSFVKILALIVMLYSSTVDRFAQGKRKRGALSTKTCRRVVSI